eukprot:sb/3472857/
MYTVTFSPLNQTVPVLSTSPPPPGVWEQRNERIYILFPRLHLLSTLLNPRQNFSPSPKQNSLNKFISLRRGASVCHTAPATPFTTCRLSVVDDNQADDKIQEGEKEQYPDDNRSPIKSCRTWTTIVLTLLCGMVNAPRECQHDACWSGIPPYGFHKSSR